MSRPDTLAHELAQAIENDIVSGVLQPGDRLDERALGERFKVSRTPVREALVKLSASGLITTWPRHGVVVAPIAVKELIEMFEVMAELESLCARLAARRILPAERDRLARLHDECQRVHFEGDADAYYVANVDLHEAVYAASKNGYLERQTKAVRNRLSPYRRLQLRRPGRLASSNQEHGSVIEAILEGDADAAATAMREHVNVQGAALNDLIAILPPNYLERRAG